jgi:hypothetical protein
MVQLTDGLLRSLDEAAALRGVSRSKLIRELVSDGLRRAGEDEVGEQIRAGYRRIPQAEPDEWGDLLVAGEFSTVELLVRLDAEERSAGHGPW